MASTSWARRAPFMCGKSRASRRSWKCPVLFFSCFATRGHTSCRHSMRRCDRESVRFQGWPQTAGYHLIFPHHRTEVAGSLRCKMPSMRATRESRRCAVAAKQRAALHVPTRPRRVILNPRILCHFFQSPPFTLHSSLVVLASFALCSMFRTLVFALGVCHDSRK